jgi:glycolate oxidase iron-sulfur subunit
MNLTELNTVIQQEANQCVKCGLCLPACPTYTLTQNECESPRGRIALLDGLTKQQLPFTDKAQLYLDHCLTCRACEAVCPAQVQYGKLIDHGRMLLEQAVTPQKRVTRLPRILNLMTQYPTLMLYLKGLLKFYQRTGLQYFLRKTSFLKKLKLQRIDALLPALPSAVSLKNYYPAQTTVQGSVALFTGCMSNLVDQTTLLATIKVLTYCGYNVYVPAEQRCCGAMHLHAGHAKEAQQFSAINRQAFKQYNVEAIITVVSGCAVVLKEYLVPVFDVSQFLTQITWPTQLRLKALAQSVVVHTPCTMRNVLQQAQAPIKLLQKIPELKLYYLKNTGCCGAAGAYLLQHPQMAEQLLQNVLNELLGMQEKIDWLLTSNLGCHLHIAKALREKGYKISIAHPIVLFAQQLDF